MFQWWPQKRISNEVVQRFKFGDENLVFNTLGKCAPKQSVKLLEMQHKMQIIESWLSRNCEEWKLRQKILRDRNSSALLEVFFNQNHLFMLRGRVKISETISSKALSQRNPFHIKEGLQKVCSLKYTLQLYSLLLISQESSFHNVTSFGSLPSLPSPISSHYPIL